MSTVIVLGLLIIIILLRRVLFCVALNLALYSLGALALLGFLALVIVQ